MFQYSEISTQQQRYYDITWFFFSWFKDQETQKQYRDNASLLWLLTFVSGDSISWDWLQFISGLMCLKRVCDHKYFRYICSLFQTCPKWLGLFCFRLLVMHQDTFTFTLQICCGTGLDHLWMWFKGVDHQIFPTLEEYNCVTSDQSTGVWMMMTQSIIKPHRSDGSTAQTEKQWPFLGQSLNPAGLRQRVTTKPAAKHDLNSCSTWQPQTGTITSCVTSRDSWLATPGLMLP